MITKFLSAVIYNNTKIVARLLKDDSVDVNAVEDCHQYSALLLATSGNDIDSEIVHMLIRNSRVNKNAHNDVGNTPLIMCSINNRPQYIQLLIDNGALIDDANERGDNALTIAADKNYYECIELLLKNGANINHVGDNGCSALIRALFNNFTECAKLLLTHEKVDVNIVESTGGYTALMFAAYNNNTECVKLLLEKENIDVDVKAKNGFTALMIAKTRGASECVELLS